MTTYYGLTPRDTRRTPADAMTRCWFTGLIPITVPIAAWRSAMPPEPQTRSTRA